ncbi:MAG: MerC domain-containing protein [Bacteroidota bacterium]
MIVKTRPKSDVIGAMASGLCVLHCLATPFLFIAQTCSVSDCCNSGPVWWSAIDYLFVGITFFAVYHSSKSTSQDWVKYALYTTWVMLTFLVLNEKLGFLPIAEYWKYLTAFGLISVHMYNLKFCQCVEEPCCVA